LRLLGYIEERSALDEEPEPAGLPDSALRPRLLPEREGERTQRHAEGGQLDWLLRRPAKRQSDHRTHHADPRHHRQQRRARADRHVPRRDQAGEVTMARLSATILTSDDVFRARLSEMLRSGSVRVSVIDDRLARGSAGSDVAIVDGRRDPAEAMTTIERLRAASATGAIFMVAAEASPDLILQSMRAGANEFFAWPLQETPFGEAIVRVASRVQSTSGTRPQAYVLMFLGAKGGVGTTTLAVNCAVDLRRLSGQSTV